MIPDVVDEIGIANTRKLALWRKGNGNPTVESLAFVHTSLYSGANEIKSVAPQAIQVYPILTLELWTWVLWAGLRP